MNYNPVFNLDITKEYDNYRSKVLDLYRVFVGTMKPWDDIDLFMEELGQLFNAEGLDQKIAFKILASALEPSSSQSARYLIEVIKRVYGKPAYPTIFNKNIDEQ